MADIAFLLLIFFLVTTTMDTDTGIVRQLPPWQEQQNENTDKINERNIFVVLINRDDRLLVEGRPMDISQLREKAYEFVTNPLAKENLPDKTLVSRRIEVAQTTLLAVQGDENATAVAQAELDTWTKAKEMIGGDDFAISKGIISLQNDRGTTYGQYITVQNELVAAFSRYRDETSMKYFGNPFDKCTVEQQDVIKLLIPQAISEAEPKNIGG